MSITYFNRFADGDDMSAFDAAFAAQLRGQRDKLVENLLGAAAAQYDVSSGVEPYGGFRRVLAGVHAGVSGDVFVLDDEMDWRDRMLFIVGPSSLSALHGLYPGHPDDALINAGSGIGLVAVHCYYTGSGYAAPGGSPGNNYHKLYNSDDLQLYAAVNTGELHLEFGATAQFAMNLVIYASPKMGARGSTVGTTYVTNASLYDAADGSPVEPHDLNNLQDAVHIGQVKGADTIALGPIGHGDPKLPYEWNVRGSTLRQRLTEPALRRYVSATMLIDELLLLDDSFDWRDRFVWAAGNFSLTIDRRPGETSDAGNGSYSTADSEATFLAGYTGSGDDGSDHDGGAERYTLRQLATIPATPFFLYADQDTGHLYASTFDPGPGTNDNDKAPTIDLVICASPRIGPRSEPTPAKLEEDLPAKKVVGTLIDSANADLTNIVARWRMDRGLAIDGGKVAAIADQSGGGYHLRQLDPDLRSVEPVTRSALNSQLCIPLSGVEYYETVKPLPASVAGYHIAVVCEPLSTPATVELWKHVLALSSEGAISGLISGTQVDAQWLPTASTTPPFLRRDATAAYAAGIGLGVEWDFSVDSDPARLAPDVTVRPVGGSPSSAFLVSTSPAGVGSADVQSLVWRLFEGFHGYVAEVIICSAGQAAVDDFLTSTDIVSRYAF